MYLELDPVDEDFQELLENDSVQQREPIQIVDVEAPAGFGRSEYKKMVQDLWGEGQKRKMTTAKRGAELLDEDMEIIAQGLSNINEGVRPRDADPGKIADGLFETTAGAFSMLADPIYAVVASGIDSSIDRVELGSYTLSDHVYDQEGGPDNGHLAVQTGFDRTARIFYTADGDDRYVTVAPGNPGYGLDIEVAEETIRYLDEFEA